VGAPYWREEMNRGSNVFAFVGVAMLGPRDPATQRAARAGVTLPPAFDGWFARATAPIPEHRFPSATAAVSALGDVLAIPVSYTAGLGASGNLSGGHASQASHASLTGPTSVVALSGALPATPFSDGSTPSPAFETVALTESAFLVQEPAPAPKRRSGLVAGIAAVAGVVVLGLAAVLGGRMVLGARPAPVETAHAAAAMGAPAAPAVLSVPTAEPTARAVDPAELPAPSITPAATPVTSATSATPAPAATQAAAPAPSLPRPLGGPLRKSKPRSAAGDDDIYVRK